MPLTVNNVVICGESYINGDPEKGGSRCAEEEERMMSGKTSQS